MFDGTAETDGLVDSPATELGVLKRAGDAAEVELSLISTASRVARHLALLRGSDEPVTVPFG